MNIIRGSFQSNLSIQLCLFSEYFLCCNNQKLVLTSCFSFVQSAQELQLCFPKTHFSTNILRKWTCKLARQVDIEIQALTHSGGKTNLTNAMFLKIWCYDSFDTVGVLALFISTQVFHLEFELCVQM